MTPEPTKDPSHFDIPNNTVYVTDDLQSTVNLVGSADEDTKLNKALAIRWNTNVTGILNFHLYVQVNGGERQYFAQTRDPNVFAFEWKKDAVGLDPTFQDGPQFNYSYRFWVFGVKAEKPNLALHAADSVLS